MEIRALGVGELPLPRVPSGRLKMLARYAAAARLAGGVVVKNGCAKRNGCFFVAGPVFAVFFMVSPDFLRGFIFSVSGRREIHAFPEWLASVKTPRGFDQLFLSFPGVRVWCLPARKIRFSVVAQFSLVTKLQFGNAITRETSFRRRRTSPEPPLPLHPPVAERNGVSQIPALPNWSLVTSGTREMVSQYSEGASEYSEEILGNGLMKE